MLRPSGRENPDDSRYSGSFCSGPVDVAGTGLCRHSAYLVLVIGLLLVSCSSSPAVNSSPRPTTPGTPSIALAEPSPSATASSDAGDEDTQRARPTRVPDPRQVRAVALSSSRVRISWNRSPRTRYYTVLDSGEVLERRVQTRHVSVQVAYGTHCFRVIAVAERDFRNSSPSPCATITLSPPPSEAPESSSGGSDCPPGYVRNGVPPFECTLNDY